MRIGIYGGAFDPVHVGHLLLAEQCREQCRLDEVWFVPTGQPSHREPLRATAAQRLDMLSFATAGVREFVVSRLEIDRASVSYTVDTLRQIRVDRPHDELCLLIGADSLRDFMTWREPESIAELAEIVAVNRGTDSATNWLAGLPNEVSQRVRFVEMPGIAISASDIRSRVAASRSIRFLVPRAVEVYIQERKLYLA